jgi:hypothetical protein
MAYIDEEGYGSFLPALTVLRAKRLRHISRLFKTLIWQAINAVTNLLIRAIALRALKQILLTGGIIRAFQVLLYLNGCRTCHESLLLSYHWNGAVLCASFALADVPILTIPGVVQPTSLSTLTPVKT